MDSLLFGIVLLQVLSSAWCYPTGAPESTCVDMMPKHGAVQPQTSPSPYSVQLSSTTFQPGKPLNVVIKGPVYGGLLLQARSGSNTNAIGTWQAPPVNTKLLPCTGNPQGAVTHYNTSPKNNATVFTWTPPATARSVFFMATVAQQRTVFWVNVKSATLASSGGTALDVNGGAEKVSASVVALCLLLTSLNYLFV